MSSTLVGLHAAEEFVRRDDAAGTLYVSGKNKRLAAIVEQARRRGLRVESVGQAELARIGGGAARYVVVVAAGAGGAKRPADLKEFLAGLKSEHAMVVLLDGVTDPHNLGAIIRSADQFAAELVVIPSRRSAHETQTVARTSAGAIVHVPLLEVTNIVQAMQELKEGGFWVYGADAAGSPAHTQKLTGRVALVLGSEGAGLGRLVREKCDEISSIPTAGHVDSLNVSVAAGILMYEVRRQQGALTSGH